MSTGSSWRSPDQKPLYRLREALFLAHLLRPTHGPQVVTRYDPASFVTLRRRFQRNLASICDYKKGGASTTAIAIEEADECSRFWVSSNEGVSDRTSGSLRQVLGILNRHIETNGGPGVTEEKLGRKCVAFSRDRVRNAAVRLRNISEKCISHLRKSGDGPERVTAESLQVMVLWLKNLVPDKDTSDLYDICQRAYAIRHDSEVGLLERLGRDPADGTNIGDVAKDFRAVKHFIGRLAVYIRISKQLVEDASRLKETHVLDIHEVSVVDLPRPAPVPLVDSQVCLEGILKRMLDHEDPSLPQMLDSLQKLDDAHSLEREIRNKFSGGVKPCVHAEIQMLEHFAGRQLDFKWRDRYIACSKPACLACRVYVENHPGRFVRFDSHEKLYPNWAPAVQLDDKGRAVPVPNRALLTAVIRGVRDVALQQIDELSVSRDWHPDTLTVITQEEDMFLEGDSSEDSDLDEGAPL